MVWVAVKKVGKGVGGKGAEEGDCAVFGNRITAAEIFVGWLIGHYRNFRGL